MARVKRGVTAHKRHKRLLKAAEGHKKNAYGAYLKMVAENEVPNAL